MSDPTFTTVGDEALEARIVSWVLGEASAFEAAELERLCAERPELAHFRNRIDTMNGLLADAENPAQNEDWKLPAEKRKPIEELIATQPVPEVEAQRERRIHHSARRAILAIAACAVITVVVLELTTPNGFVIRRYGRPMMSRADSGTILTYSAPEQSDSPAFAVNEKKVELRPDFPKELIEGTPRPMVFPQRTPGKNRLAMREETRETAVETKPSAPSSSVAKLMASGPDESAAIPVPEVALNEPSPDFGGGSDFGNGWTDLPGGATRARAGAAKQQNEVDAFAMADDAGFDERPASPPAPAARLLATSERQSTGGLAPELAMSGLSAGVEREKRKQYESGEAGRRDGLLELGKGAASAAFEVDREIRSLDQVLDREEGGRIAGAFQPADALGGQAEGLVSGEKRESVSDGRLMEEVQETRFARDSADKDGADRKSDQTPTVEPAKRPKPAEFEKETSAAEDPFSTFSLNISDASFRIAQAALAKGEQPDPAGIKVEQFYNAVDYGDPAPATGEPVACAVEQVAHPVIPGRNLVRIALKTGAAGRSAGQPLRLTLLVDQSGSMSRGDRREAMDRALEGLAGLLTPQDQVNVVGFSRTSRLIAEGMTGDKAIDTLADVVNPSASEGGTNMETAIDLATELALRHKIDGAQNRIVLFTDGAANLGDADPERLAAKIEQLRQQGLALDIAGIAAEDINDRLLAELARKGNGRYHIVGKGDGGHFAKQLAGAFRPAAENVKVQVRFNPERVSGYKLLGFEKDRLKTEDFRNDAVDAAEMAAEEAGVAIYQVEPLPDGRGEIGEVSVRFRDTATGEMVERSWTLAYNPATPAIDRATPSMQLATLALFAGEKLKGGPLGQAIDFNNFSAVQASVKQAFGHDARIGELLRMVDALK